MIVTIRGSRLVSLTKIAHSRLSKRLKIFETTTYFKYFFLLLIIGITLHFVWEGLSIATFFKIKVETKNSLPNFKEAKKNFKNLTF